MSVKIAVVQASDGHLTCVGPNDFKPTEYDNSMDAAIGWHIEAGYMPAATYWVMVDLPALPAVHEIAGVVQVMDGASDE
jgi:hypothetical protein